MSRPILSPAERQLLRKATDARSLAKRRVQNAQYHRQYMTDRPGLAAIYQARWRAKQP